MRHGQAAELLAVLLEINRDDPRNVFALRKRILALDGEIEALVTHNQALSDTMGTVIVALVDQSQLQADGPPTGPRTRSGPAS